MNPIDPIEQARSIVRGYARRRLTREVQRAAGGRSYLALIYGYLAAYHAALPRTSADGAQPREPD